ncbi:MAG: folate family ECF transporter S component, partial [Clostridium sp.]|jgi:ECF transporter S component (folate family)|nr:folate family ECF transporter S component [Clostridium sp.]
MTKFQEILSSSKEEMKNTNSIALSGMFIAISVVLSLFKIDLAPTIQISFASLPIAAGGMLFGPMVGAAIGIISDILGYIVHPSGFYFPGFTLNAMLIGIIFGFIFYNRKLSLRLVIITSIAVTVIINWGLTTLWLSIMYKNAFFVLLGARIIKNIILFPIDTSLLFGVLKLVKKIEFFRNKSVK